MSKKNGQIHPALKHGGYSGTTLLPGEDRNVFEKLHRDLITEFASGGPMEEDIVATMARLVWRKQNLSTYRLAELAKNRKAAISAKFGPRYDFEMLTLGKICAVRTKSTRIARQRRRKLETNSATQWLLLKWERP